jgi:pimeloyl-ACP methyl ester carboxylesterase
MTSHTIKLSDGRQLGYAVYGSSAGKPVLYFHGTPSSRLELLLLQHYGVDLEGILAEAGLKLLAVDRPGMGLSTFNPKGDFLSFAADAGELMQQLGILNCPVLCWSGGGPYALATAYRYPARITSATIICGFSRHFDDEVVKAMHRNVWYFRAAKYMPAVLRAGLYTISRRKPRHTPSQKMTGLPFKDFQYMRRLKDLRTLARYTLMEACRVNAKGAVQEARNYFKHFGFDLTTIQQPVHYWWGSQDVSVIELHALAVERYVPNATMHYRAHEGHLSIWVRHMKEVLQAISTH